MKAHHYLLIIAATLGILYFVSKKQKKQTKNTGTGTKTPTLEEQYPEPDTSENAEYATLTTAEALKILNDPNTGRTELDGDTGDEPKYRYTFSYTDKNGKSHYHFISKRTWEAICPVDFVNFYSPDVETYSSTTKIDTAKALELVKKAGYSTIVTDYDNYDDEVMVKPGSLCYLVVGEKWHDPNAKTYIISTDTWHVLCPVNEYNWN